jgi:translocation and assembly module TamA
MGDARVAWRISLRSRPASGQGARRAGALVRSATRVLGVTLALASGPALSALADGVAPPADETAALETAVPEGAVPEGAGLAADSLLVVKLDAPDALRPLLERHLRVLGPDPVRLPQAASDRIALLRRVRRDAAGLLATEGYFSPRIRFDRSDPARWRLSVEPGARAQIAGVSLEFAGAIVDAGAGTADGPTPAALRAAWRLPVGEPFRQAQWDEAKAQLLDTLTARLYAAARIVHSRAEVDAEAASVHLSLRVDSGPPFYLGELQVSGLRDLPVDLVTRYSTLQAGAAYDRDALLEFQSRLQNTAHFASVQVDVGLDPGLAAAVPVQVQVAEAKPRHLGFGAGFSSNTGYRVETRYRDTNLLQRACELSSGLRLEQHRSSAYADVFLPPQGRERYSVGALIDRSDVEGLRVDSEAVGVERKSVRGDIESRIALRLQRERLQPDGIEASRQDALTVNWTWIRRAVDDLLDPRRGHVLEFQAGGGSSLALSEQDFARFYLRQAYYWPLGRRDVLILRAEAGATLAPGREGIPQDFLFRTGGAQSVRGYAYQSLGVRTGDAVLGARYLAVGSAEYVHWFDADWGAAAFVDTGDAPEAWSDLTLRTGYGIGARWRSPAGPLAVDLAWGESENALRLHFGVAIAF